MDFTKIAPPRFHVQDTEAFPHHDTVSALWQKKWQAPCSKGIYPFTDGIIEDFEPIFTELIELSGDDTRFLYKPDAYAAPFFPVIHSLMARAAKAESAGDIETAKNLYLRAGAVCRISRFPIIRSEKSALAWKLNKEAYAKASKYMNPPNQMVNIPFKHRDVSLGDAGGDIQAYFRIPNGSIPEGGWPVLLFICGLDSYRTDITLRIQKHVDGGFAVLSFEIPGTGDCPASRSDPESPDRLMSSVIDWVRDSATEYELDINKICARGISTGSYYAARVAHTHADRLFAVAAQGAGTHYMFHPSWVRAMDKQEYPFALAEAIACKFGHGTGDVESFLASDPMTKYSLLKQNIVGKDSCKMLLINGMEDSVFPIEDSILVATAGRNKDLIVRANLEHMGDPGGDRIVEEWLVEVINSKA